MDSTPRFAPETVSPLLIVLNPGSGRTDVAATRATIEQMLTQAGRAYKLFVVDVGASLADMAQRAVEEARACGGVVVAAGGDGTISTVAQATLGSGCVFGILPQGTFNYFGRAHGISENTDEAVQSLLCGQVQSVQVGLVNDRAFLVNASMGLHSQMLEDREAYTRQYGRSRLVAFWAGLPTLLHHHRQLRISLELEGRIREMSTPTLFVCNNSLQLEQIGVPLSQKLEQGRLAAIMLRPVGILAMLWLLVRGAFGQLGEAKNVISFAFDTMKVRQPVFYGKSRIKVSIDGEITEMYPPLEFRVSTEPLYLLMPRLDIERKDSLSNPNVST